MTPPPPAENELIPPPSNRRWLYVGIGLLILIVLAYFGIFRLATMLEAPAVKSIDEIDVAKLNSMAVLAINRPDEGPDISGGGKEPFRVSEEDFSTVLMPLRNAKPISAHRGVYLGFIQIGFQDGRKLKVMLHRVGDGKDPSRPAVLRYTIANYQYEVSPLDAFLKPLAEVEAKARSRR